MPLTRLWQSFLFGGLLLAALSPYLLSDFYLDDSHARFLRQHFELRGLTLWQGTWSEIRHWVEDGRLFPVLLFLHSALFYGPFASLAVYRWVQCGLILASVLLMYSVVRRAGMGRAHAGLTGILLLSAFQIRDAHDPMTSYAGLLQILVLLGGTSVLLLQSYRARPRAWKLLCSLLAYTLCLLTYEVSLAFLPILLWLAGTTKGRAKWGLSREAVVFIAVTGTYLAATLFLKLRYPTQYSGTEIKLSLHSLRALAVQSSSTLPLVYPIFGRSGLFDPDQLRRFGGGLGLLALFVFPFAQRALHGLFQGPSGEPRPSRQLKILGWSLFLIPSLILALSSRYQQEISRPGAAYLPIFISCFGMAVLVAPALMPFARRHSRAVSVILGAVFALSISLNHLAVNGLNAYWRTPRVAIEKAAREGLFSQLPENARLEFKPRISETRFVAWVGPPAILALSGKRVQMPVTTGPRHVLEYDEATRAVSLRFQP